MAQHTWISPGGRIKNQTDFVLVDNRSRNGVKNSKAMPGAHCETDHKPVIARLKIKLQRVRKLKQAKKWNVNRLKNTDVRDTFKIGRASCRERVKNLVVEESGKKKR